MSNQKQYEKLKREVEKLQDIINQKEDECARNGDSFEIMIEKTKQERNQYYEITKKMRLLKEPVMEFGKNFFDSQKFTFEQFVNMAKDGSLTDSDGHGYYATENGISDITIMPSDITENMYRNDFTYVVWFSK